MKNDRITCIDPHPMNGEVTERSTINLTLNSDHLLKLRKKDASLLGRQSVASKVFILWQNNEA